MYPFFRLQDAKTFRLLIYPRGYIIRRIKNDEVEEIEFILLLAVAAVLAWRFNPVKGIRSISAAELKSMLQDRDKTFIDVRTPGEYGLRHIKQFKNVPLGSDFSTLPRENEVIVICQSGMRSSQTCRQLKKLGYEKVTNVRGGMNAYQH